MNLCQREWQEPYYPQSQEVEVLVDDSSTKPRSTLRGTLSGFLGEALLFPTGLVTAAFLTRSLGPQNYGLLTLAATLIGWLGWGTAAIFARATVKFISEAEDWRPIGTTVLQQHLIVSLSVTLIFCLFAERIAQVMGEPTLTAYLLLFAWEIPLFAMARAHRVILIGLGCFAEQAIAGGSRWLARLLLIVGLVSLGLSVSGAILGSLGSASIELAIARFYVRPPLFGRSSFPAWQLWDYAVPLTLFALSMRCFDRLDLLMLKAMGGTAEQAGIYGAAQNLALIPGLFATSLAPVLLSNVNRSLKDGDINRAKKMSQQAMRLVLLMLPCAAITAGAASEIVQLIFGVFYVSAAPLLTVLMLGGFAQMMISVGTAILIAADRPYWTFILTAPMLPLVALGHTLLIPRLSALGASLSTTLIASLGAMATVIAVYRIWRILPPPLTLVRTLLVCGIIYALTTSISSPSFWLPLKLAALTLLVPLIFLLLGEFKGEEMSLVGTLVPGLQRLFKVTKK